MNDKLCAKIKFLFQITKFFIFLLFYCYHFLYIEQCLNITKISYK